jgi:hydroxypyruvate isomerase
VGRAFAFSRRGARAEECLVATFTVVLIDRPAWYVPVMSLVPSRQHTEDVFESSAPHPVTARGPAAATPSGAGGKQVPLKFAANLAWLFTEVPFMDRFAAARQAGFDHVELVHPYEYSAEALKDALDRNGQEIVLFLLPSGNWAGGDRGIAASPDRTEEFRAGIRTAVAYARLLGVPRMNCMAGKMVPGFSRREHLRTMAENIKFAADALGAIGVKVVIEHVNPYTIPGFLLTRVEEVLEVIAAANRPNVHVQYDIYHAQRAEGNLTEILRNHIAQIDHIHVGDTPGRHQPGTGEIRYRFLFSEMDRLGYSQFVGLEYEPIPDTLNSLGWLNEYGLQRGSKARSA